MIGARIGVVVVTYQSQRVISECLGSLIERLPFDAPIVVVDNASTDATTNIVLGFSPRVRLLRNRRNVGFAAANNRGAGTEGLGDAVDWVFLINPDATLTGFDAELFARDAKDGSVGQLAYFTNGSLDSGAAAVRRMPSSIGTLLRYTWGLLRPAWFPELAAIPPRGTAVWAPGSFCAVRRSALELVGGFDDRFFLYHEDVDLSKRLVEAGFLVRTSHAAIACHFLGSGAGGLSDAERIAFAVSGWLTYERKWRGGDHVQRLWSLYRANLAIEAVALRPLRRLNPTIGRKASEVAELRDMVEHAECRVPTARGVRAPEIAIRASLQPRMSHCLDGSFKRSRPGCQ